MSTNDNYPITLQNCIFFECHCTPTIIHAEDDKGTLLGVEEFVLKEACPQARVINFKNGAEALQHCLTSPPTLLITNVGMPVMGGIELIKNLIQSGLHIPTIITSGFSTAERCKAARISLGKDVLFFSKPLDSKIFQDAVKKLIKMSLKNNRNASYLQDKVSLYEYMINLAPNDPMNYLQKGWALRALGKNNQAIEALEKGLSLVRCENLMPPINKD